MRIQNLVVLSIIIGLILPGTPTFAKDASVEKSIGKDSVCVTTLADATKEPEALVKEYAAGYKNSKDKSPYMQNLQSSIKEAQSGDWKKALTDINAALKLKPRDVDLLLLRAAINYKLGDAKGRTDDLSAICDCRLSSGPSVSKSIVQKESKN